MLTDMDQLAIFEQQVRAIVARKPGGWVAKDEKNLRLLLSFVRTLPPYLIKDISADMATGKNSDMNFKQFVRYLKAEFARRYSDA